MLRSAFLGLLVIACTYRPPTFTVKHSEKLKVTGNTGTMALPTTLTGDVSIEVFGRTTATPVCNGPRSCDLEDPINGTFTATIN